MAGISGPSVVSCQRSAFTIAKTINIRLLHVADSLYIFGSRKQESGSKNQETRIRKQVSGNENQEARIRKQESGSKNQEARIRKPESGSQNQETRFRKQDRTQVRAVISFETLNPSEFILPLIFCCSYLAHGRARHPVTFFNQVFQSVFK